MNVNHEAPRCVIFYSLLLFPSSEVQAHFSAPFPRAFSVFSPLYLKEQDSNMNKVIGKLLFL